jgi:hypothetical protein
MAHSRSTNETSQDFSQGSSQEDEEDIKIEKILKKLPTNFVRPKKCKILRKDSDEEEEEEFKMPKPVSFAHRDKSFPPPVLIDPFEYDRSRLAAGIPPRHKSPPLSPRSKSNEAARVLPKKLQLLRD